MRNKVTKIVGMNPLVARIVYGLMGLSGILLAYIYGFNGLVYNETKVLKKFAEDVTLTNHQLTPLVSVANLLLFGMLGLFSISIAIFPDTLRKLQHPPKIKNSFMKHIIILLSLVVLLLFICSFFVLVIVSTKYS